MGKKTAFLAIDKRDGSVMRRFETAREAAVWGGVVEHTVRDSARKRMLSQSRHFWRREDEWLGSEVFSETAKGRPVVAMGRGHLYWFPTVADAAAALVATDHAVHEAIREKSRLYGEWQVAHLTSTEDWPRLMEKFDVRRNGQ